MMWGLGYNGARGCLGWGAGFMPGGFMFLIGLILLIAAVVLLVILLKKRRSGNEPGDEALDLLRLRLAKGEIDEEEYNRRKTVLKG